MPFENAHERLQLKPLITFGITAALGLAFAQAAHAQSSVTLYGIVDAGVERVNNTAAGGIQTRATSGNLSGSRWGMKGVEALGGGWNAIFALENAFNVNDGTTGQSTRGLGTNPTTTTRLFGRQAWVGLSGKGQQLTLGRQNSILYDQAVSFDPTGAASRYSMLALDYATAARVDNSARYAGTFGPLTATAIYSTRYDTGYGAEVPGAEITGRYFGGSLTYGSGPLAATVSFEQRNSNTVATNTGTERRVTGAATYVLGDVKTFAGYEFLRASRAFLPANPIVPATGADAGYAGLFWLGAQYRITPAFQLTAAGYYRNLHASSADPWIAVVNADYSLSKRTDVYASVGFAHNKSGSALGLNGYGTVAPGYNQTGMVVGIRQRF
jgi:predicted porin